MPWHAILAFPMARYVFVSPCLLSSDMLWQGFDIRTGTAGNGQVFKWQVVSITDEFEGFAPSHGKLSCWTFVWRCTFCRPVLKSIRNSATMSTTKSRSHSPFSLRSKGALLNQTISSDIYIEQVLATLTRLLTSRSRTHHLSNSVLCRIGSWWDYPPKDRRH